MTDRARLAGLALGLYAAAFVLLLVAGALLAAAVLDELQETGLLRISAALSGAAIVVAVLSVMLPRRSAG